MTEVKATEENANASLELEEDENDEESIYSDPNGNFDDEKYFH
jgi:hypothetical protein